MNIKKEEIEQILSLFIGESIGPVCIMAGHFSLYPESNYLVPAIFQDIEDKTLSDLIKFHPYMGYLPIETFSMAVNHFSEKTNFAFMVNDWQHVPKSTAAPHLMNNFRKVFYEKNHELPNSFKKLFAEKATKESIISPGKFGLSGNKIYFSESKLRQYFDNNLAIQACDLKNSCAQEYLPFIQYVESLQYQRLVSFIPGTCKAPISQSTNYAIENGCKMQILNIYCHGGSSPDEFWERTQTEIVRPE